MHRRTPTMLRHLILPLLLLLSVQANPLRVDHWDKKLTGKARCE
jgi:hypothetical protein